MLYGTAVIAYILRFCARCFLALTEKLLFGKITIFRGALQKNRKQGRQPILTLLAKHRVERILAVAAKSAA